MKLVESILTKNPCFTAGRKITVKGLMLHSVGCPQPSASVFVKNWNSASYSSTCVHGFIDGNDGTVYQTLPWDHRGWHCGSGSKGSGSNTHIGVEMCEPACIKYTGGSHFTCSDTATAKAVTYQAAVELFAMLCEKYGLDPLADGVVISHKEGCARGIASNHGDPEHLWTQLGLPYTMDTFRKAVKVAMGGVSGTKIMGAAVATADQMRAYIKTKNPKVAQSVLDMVPLYLSEGAAEGVRGDITLAQSCLETGNFAFAGFAVTLDQNNFCGMGVTANGMKGNSFSTAQLGIRAQVQHLKAYASTEPLKGKCIDPRFKYVVRGCAEVVEWLGQKDPPGQGLGDKRIAAITGYSLNTVKSVCRRSQAPAGKRCLQCGAAVEQPPHRKEKKFCSDKCRMAWWNSHPERVNRKAFYHMVCTHCGQPFDSYGNDHRKYCSRRCYDDARRKGME